MAAGREWFIHTIYTVHSRENANHNIGKRSVEYLQHGLSSFEQPHTSDTSSHYRTAPLLSAPILAQDIGVQNSRGTNIQHIALDRSDRLVVSQRKPWSPNPNPSLEHPLLESSGRQPADTLYLPLLVGIAGLVLLICIVTAVVILLLRHKRREKKMAFPSYTTSSSSAYSRGVAGTLSSSDSSEV